MRATEAREGVDAPAAAKGDKEFKKAVVEMLGVLDARANEIEANLFVAMKLPTSECTELANAETVYKENMPKTKGEKHPWGH